MMTTTQRLITVALALSLATDPALAGALSSHTAQPPNPSHQAVFAQQTLLAPFAAGTRPAFGDIAHRRRSMAGQFWRAAYPARASSSAIAWREAGALFATIVAAVFGMPLPIASVIDTQSGAYELPDGYYTPTNPEIIHKRSLHALKNLPDLLHDLSNLTMAIHSTYNRIKEDPDYPLSADMEEELDRVDAMMAVFLNELRFIQTQADETNRMKLMKGIVENFDARIGSIRIRVENLHRSLMVRPIHFDNLRKGIGLAEDAFRVSQGRAHKRYFNMNNLLRDVVRQAQAMAQPHNQIKVLMQRNLPKAWGLRGELSKVILNLLTNALHAVGNKPDGIVRVTTRRGASDPASVSITVEDNGYGIDPKLLPPNQPNILTRGLTTKPAGEGTGLGLDIIHEVIQHHMGVLEIHSPGVGKGSTFRVELPGKEFQIAPKGHAKAKPISPAVKRLKLLLVDDEPYLREMIRMYFELHDFEVIEADDGMSAIELFKPGTFSAALIDGRMPRVSGIEVIRHIQKLEPGLPMVFTSDYALSKDEVLNEFPTGEYPHIELSHQKEPYDLHQRLNRLIEQRARGDQKPGRNTPRTPWLMVPLAVFMGAWDIPGVPALTLAGVLGALLAAFVSPKRLDSPSTRARFRAAA